MSVSDVHPHDLMLDDDGHPIDMIEALAEHYDWEFDRLNEDQIAMMVEGQWRTYSVTLAWVAHDETLRMVCSYEMEPPADTLPTLYQTLNLVNDQCWSGAFTFWPEQQLMLYRYALILSGTDGVTGEQVEAIISAAISCAERFYPTFSVAIWSGYTPTEALEVAIAEAYGRA